MGRDSTGFKLHYLDEFRYSDDMTAKMERTWGCGPAIAITPKLS